MARARDRNAHVGSMIVMLPVITFAVRGAGGQPVIAVRRVRSELMLVGLALACRERAEGEVHSEEYEQNGETDQPTQCPPRTAGSRTAFHSQGL